MRYSYTTVALAALLGSAIANPLNHARFHKRSPDVLGYALLKMKNPLLT